MAPKKKAPKPKGKEPKVAPAGSAIGRAIDKGIEAGEIDADHMVTYKRLRELKG